MTLSSRLIGAIAALLLSLFALGAVTAQTSPSPRSEPTLQQIYQAAGAGEIARAQLMVDDVLKAHPKSAKAHYVKSELSARQHDYAAAREELAAAEKLAPGLPFVKSESLQSLRRRIGQASAAGESATHSMGAGPDTAPPAGETARGLPWGPIALVALVLGAGAFVMRRRAAPRSADHASATPNYAGNPAAPYGNPPGYTPGYPQGPGQPQQPGMGSSVMRGLGAGLAVGAGAVAAQEIGRRIFSHDNPQGNVAGADPGAIDNGMRNADMGGDNFGIAGGGWDDAGGGMADNDFGDIGGGGGDWDT